MIVESIAFVAFSMESAVIESTFMESCGVVFFSEEKKPQALKDKINTKAKKPSLKRFFMF